MDIAFSKYKEKGRRTIDFDRFQDAVASLALAKFPGLPEDAAFEAACAQILAAGGPALVGASKPRTDGICEFTFLLAASRRKSIIMMIIARLQLCQMRLRLGVAVRLRVVWPRCI